MFGKQHKIKFDSQEIVGRYLRIIGLWAVESYVCLWLAWLLTGCIEHKEEYDYKDNINVDVNIDRAM